MEYPSGKQADHATVVKITSDELGGMEDGRGRGALLSLGVGRPESIVSTNTSHISIPDFRRIFCLAGKVFAHYHEMHAAHSAMSS